MQPWAERFYKGKRWQRVSREFRQSKGGLCERCLARGTYRPSDMVHHKIALTPGNINDPMITYNYDNLEALCLPCHDDETNLKNKEYIRSDLMFDQDGKVVPRY